MYELNKYIYINIFVINASILITVRNRQADKKDND